MESNRKQKKLNKNVHSSTSLINTVSSYYHQRSHPRVHSSSTLSCLYNQHSYVLNTPQVCKYERTDSIVPRGGWGNPHPSPGGSVLPRLVAENSQVQKCWFCLQNEVEPTCSAHYERRSGLISAPEWHGVWTYLPHPQRSWHAPLPTADLQLPLAHSIRLSLPPR